MNEPEKNSLEDFNARFFALQKEAYAWGLFSIVTLLESSPLDRKETQMTNYYGSRCACIGMAIRAQDLIVNGEPYNAPEDE